MGNEHSQRTITGAEEGRDVIIEYKGKTKKGQLSVPSFFISTQQHIKTVAYLSDYGFIRDCEKSVALELLDSMRIASEEVAHLIQGNDVSDLMWQLHTIEKERQQLQDKNSLMLAELGNHNRILLTAKSLLQDKKISSSPPQSCAKNLESSEKVIRLNGHLRSMAKRANSMTAESLVKGSVSIPSLLEYCSLRAKQNAQYDGRNNFLLSIVSCLADALLAGTSWKGKLVIVNGSLKSVSWSE